MATYFIALAVALITYSCSAHALTALQPQSNTFDSNATVGPEPGIPSVGTNSVQVALNFERSNWANGSVDLEDFYHLPPNASHSPAGALLKVQVDANTSAYTLPPQTALSRILFQTMTMNGTTIPASVYILWPFSPRTQPDGTYPVISWAHGTSGGYGNCAPSHIRNLWYQFKAPFTLALQGYVIVAPDYAGLGVDKDFNGNPIIHPYLVNPSAANDLFYAVEVGRSAFPILSKQFITMGHSQGGGAAWAAAQRQAITPVEGYLGTIAGSPDTNNLEILELGGAAALAAGSGPVALLARGMASIFPSFNISSVLTPAGLQRLHLLDNLQGCNSVNLELFTVAGLVQPDVLQNYYINAFQNLTGNGGRKVAGPMLVLQGTGDPIAPAVVTDKYVNLTCSLYPDSAIEYMTYEGVGHVPVMYASQQDWLGWIEGRFVGKMAN